ncbi:hypothetical protein D3C85_1845020 [compost metagenome]
MASTVAMEGLLLLQTTACGALEGATEAVSVSVAALLMDVAVLFKVTPVTVLGAVPPVCTRLISST